MKISVIMPAYNSERFIRKSIDSVLSQKGADVELIVVNDGSTDGTEQILSEYGKRIKSMTIPNGGVANARNTALSVATGDYVMFVDSDDGLAATALDEISAKIEESNADIVRYEYTMVDSKGKCLLARNRFYDNEFIPKEEFKEKIYPYFVNGIRLNSLCTLAAKRSLFSELSFKRDMKTGEDALLLLDVYTRAENILIYPRELYIYNIHGDSLTGNGLSVINKYICNFKLSHGIVKHLKSWNMLSPRWIIKAYLRPIVLTFDKIRRIKDLK